MCTDTRKEIHKQKLAWFVGYLALCANVNRFKKHISAFKTFVYL